MTQLQLAPTQSSTPRNRRGMKAPLATFQYIVIRTVQRLGRHHAYGMAIEEYITTTLPELANRIDIAQVYVTTKRLTKLGFLVPSEGQAPHGTGHTVMFYTVTPAGVRAADEAAAFFAAVAQLNGGLKSDKTQSPTCRVSKPTPQAEQKAQLYEKKSPSPSTRPPKLSRTPRARTSSRSNSQAR